MPQLPISGNLTFLYYHNLPRACEFYEKVVGLECVIDQGWCKIFQVTDRYFVGLVDGENGTHKPSDTKPVIVAFITPEVDKWYEYLIQQGVPIFKTLKTSDGIGVRGFMAKDPEGYTLEFENFIDQPRNARVRQLLNLP
jgi:predicted enzyme related to lactoylglutathione lyase